MALLIHLLLLLIFWILGTIAPEIKKTEKQGEKKIKISLKEMPKKHKETDVVKKEIKPSPVAPPMPKGEQLKKIVKKPPVKFKPDQKQNTPVLNKPQVKKEEIKKPVEKTKPIPPEKPYIPLLEEKVLEEKKIELEKKIKELEKKKIELEKKKSATDWMYEDKSEEDDKQKKKKNYNGGNISQDIKELYGDEFGKLTKGQQQYIIDNQEIMRRITQQVLTRVARVNLKANLNVNRTNVIEFYLHPNGDMTDFKFLHKSGYFVLDNTTKETIEYAYSRYPRPKEKILIRYNVYYNLARY